MFAARSLEIAHIQHDHGNGEWHDMVDVTEATNANQDPERSWLRGRIFRCTTCEDSIRIEVPEQGTAADEPLGEAGY